MNMDFIYFYENFMHKEYLMNCIFAIYFIWRLFLSMKLHKYWQKIHMSKSYTDFRNWQSFLPKFVICPQNGITLMKNK